MFMKGLLVHKDPLDNFIVGADTYKTLSQATIPTLMRFIKPYGTLNMSAGEFRAHWGSHIYFRTGTHPDSFEGISRVRRGWLDEGGKCSRYFYENMDGRCAPLEAPLDTTTTPYAMNYLAKMCKAAQAGKRPDISLVHCKSVDSPYFSRAEYERQRGLLDPRRFRMKYDGEFGAMEGLVYDLYEDCLIPSQQLERPTYYAGLDWGYYPDPFCMVIRAVTPDRKHYRVAEYYRNYLAISEIVQVMKSMDALYNFKMVYCDPSNPANIAELCKFGIPAVGANNDIRLGIDTHYALMKSGRWFMFKDTNPIGEDEYSTYHYREQRELGMDDDLKDKDRMPVDQNNHGMDCDRYLSLELEGNGVEKRAPATPNGEGPRPLDITKRLAWLKRGGNAGGGSPYA
jgi:PBSX family phage terminase large subunit